MCFNVEFSTYYFQMKEKVLADVQIYIRVPLMKCCSFNGQRQNSENLNWSTAWTVSKEGVFSGLYFPAFGLNTERYSVFGHFWRSDFVKLPTVANSEPQVILSFSWNLACLSLDAVVLHFLKISSSVFFKGFQIVSSVFSTIQD